MTSVSSKAEHEILWSEQKDCLIELLRARVALRVLLQKRMYKDRLAVGNLSAQELLSMLEAQTEDDDTDFITQITEKKRTLMSETRKMREKEKECEQTEKKIALLIKNAGQVSAMQHKPPKRKAVEGEVHEEKIPENMLNLYSNLFYALQTEPKYLAKIIDVLEDRYTPVVISEMIETILLTLFGDAFSPREENLLLTTFRLTIQSSFANIKKLNAFFEHKTIAPMVLTYVKRKQGIEFVQGTLGQLICDTVKENNNFELDAKKINIKLITQRETETGEKLSANRNMDEKTILQQPEVKAELDANAAALKRVCTSFLDAIVSNVKKVPYGLRWICKQIQNTAKQSFSGSSEDDISKVIANYIYFRFYSVAICSPEAFRIKIDDASPESRLSLLAISKVLYALFNMTPFKKNEKDKWMVPLNGWIEEHIPTVQKYYKELVDVVEPEEFLEVDTYLDLVQAVKPVILISYREIRKIHEILNDNLDDIASASADDPLRVIMKDLGKPVHYGSDDTKEIQLTLVNRFPTSVEEGATEEAQTLFNQTKMLTIRTLRMLPSDSLKKEDDVISFADLLKFSLKYAKETENAQLKKNIQTIKGNLEKLEKSQLVDKSDGYRKFMKKISLEIVNRAQICEQQRRELKRLTAHIDLVRKKEDDYTQTLETWNEYLRTCKDNQFAFKKTKKKQKGAQIGPFTYTYTELAKQRVITNSDVPKIYQKAIKFVITSDTPGLFVIEVKAPGASVDPFEIELDELLEKQSLNVERFQREISVKDEHVTVELDVNMTIHLFNKLLAKKK